MPQDVPAKGFGWFAESGFALHEEISDDEWARAVAVNGVVVNAGSDPFYSLLWRNLRSLHAVAIHLTRSQKLWGLDGGSTGIFAAVGALSNYLSSVKAFLDASATTISRQHGSSSSQAANLRKKTSEVFDAHLGYRFTVKYRNMLQHVSLGGLELQFVAEPSTGATPLVLRRDELLSQYDGWGKPVSRDLAQMEEVFPLMLLLLDGFEGLQELRREMIRLRLVGQVHEVQWLLSHLETLPMPEGALPVLVTEPVFVDGAASIQHSTLMGLNDLRSIENGLSQGDLSFFPVGSLDALLLGEGEDRTPLSSRCELGAQLVAPLVHGDSKQTDARIRTVLASGTLPGLALLGLSELTALLVFEQAALMGEPPEVVLERYVPRDIPDGPAGQVTMRLGTRMPTDGGESPDA